jgi:hypothetical protein
MRGPSNVETDAVPFTQKLDPRHPPANWRTHNFNERKLKGNLFAAERPHDTPPAHTVEDRDHSAIKVAGKFLVVESFIHLIDGVAFRSARLPQQLVELALTLEGI